MPPLPPPESDGSGDTEAPVITLVGNNPVNIFVGSTYVDSGAMTVHNVDQNLGFTFLIDGVEVPEIILDTQAPREYRITYRITDQAGNSAEAERMVIVETADPLVVETAPELSGG